MDGWWNGKRTLVDWKKVNGYQETGKQMVGRAE